MKFDYFSEKTIKVLRDAHRKASDLNFEDVGTDHILLALTDEKEIFEKLGCDSNKIKEAVKTLIGKGDSENEANTYTPRAKHVIENSISEAKDTGEVAVKPIHLLSSLLEQKGGVAIRVFENLKINAIELKNKILNEDNIQLKESKN